MQKRTPRLSVTAMNRRTGKRQHGEARSRKMGGIKVARRQGELRCYSLRWRLSASLIDVTDRSRIRHRIRVGQARFERRPTRMCRRLHGGPPLEASLSHPTPTFVRSRRGLASRTAATLVVATAMSLFRDRPRAGYKLTPSSRPAVLRIQTYSSRLTAC